MAAHDHWIPFYIGDYLADTGHLSAAQHGAYLMLIFHQCRTRKPVPNDDSRLALIAKMTRAEWDENRDVVLAFFTAVKGGLLQKRAQIEMERAEKTYKKRVKSVNEINKKRKALRQSSSQHRDSSENSTDPTSGTTTTTTKVVVRGTPVESPSPSGSGFGPSAQPARTSSRSPAKDPEIDVGDGVIFAINSNGVCDLVTSPKDAVVPAFTKTEALALRAKALDAAKPPDMPPIPPTLRRQA